MGQEYILISAVEFEALPTIKMFEKHGVSFEYLEVGIGPFLAAKSMEKWKNKFKNKDVLYLGSAGTFSKFTRPYLVTADKVWWMPTAERLGLAKNMQNLFPRIDLPGRDFFDLEKTQILSSTSVSLCDEIKVELPDKNILIENMEAYSIVSELISDAKSISIIMGITNKVGKDGSEQWLENFKKISHLTAKYLEDKLCP